MTKRARQKGWSVQAPLRRVCSVGGCPGSRSSFSTLAASPVGQEMLRQKATAVVQEVAQKEVGKPVIDQLLFTNFVLQ